MVKQPIPSGEYHAPPPPAAPHPRPPEEEGSSPSPPGKSSVPVETIAAARSEVVPLPVLSTTTTTSTPTSSYGHAHSSAPTATTTAATTTTTTAVFETASSSIPPAPGSVVGGPTRTTSSSSFPSGTNPSSSIDTTTTATATANSNMSTNRNPPHPNPNPHPDLHNHGHNHNQSTMATSQGPAGPSALDVQKYETLVRFTSLLGFHERSPSDGSGRGSSDMVLDLTSQQDRTFASASTSGPPGSSSSSSSPAMASARERIRTIRSSDHLPSTQQSLATQMMKCLHEDHDNPIGGAIVRMPAFELDADDDDGGEGDHDHRHSHTSHGRGQGQTPHGAGSAAGGDASAIASRLMPTVGQSHLDMDFTAHAGPGPGPGRDIHSISSAIGNVHMDTTNHTANTTANTTNSSSMDVSRDGPPPPAPPKPNMAASILHMMTSIADHPNVTVTPSASPSPGTTLPESTSTTTTPTTNIQSNTTNNHNNTKTNIGSIMSTSTTHLEMLASTKMTRPQSFTRSSAHHAPLALIRSLFSSFSLLVASRMKTWTLLLLRHSLSSGDRASRDRLMALLRAKNRFMLKAMVTEFEVDLNGNEDGNVDHGNGTVEDGNGKDGGGGDGDGDARRKLNCEEYLTKLWREGLARKEQRMGALGKVNSVGLGGCDLILPIKFTAVIDATIQNRDCTVHLETPGSIGAIFCEHTPKITFAEATIDPNTLINSMVQQARLIVFEAVSRATASPHANHHMAPSSTDTNGLSSLSLLDTQTSSNHKKRHRSTSFSTTTSDSQSRNSSSDDAQAYNSGSSTNLSTGKSTEKFASLLRRPGSFSMKRNNKSVQWNSNTVNAPPSQSQAQSESESPSSTSHKFKRLKKPTLSGPTLRRSTKSFGKPDADVFDNFRNATFGEFGKVDQSPHIGGRRRQSTTPSNYHYSKHLLQFKNKPGVLVGGSGGGGGSSSSGGFASSQSSSDRINAQFSALSRAAVASSSLFQNNQKPSFQDLSRSAVYSVRPPMASCLTSFQKLSSNASSVSMARTPTQLESLLLSSRTSRSPSSNSNRPDQKGGQNAKF